MLVSLPLDYSLDYIRLSSLGNNDTRTDKHIHSSLPSPRRTSVMDKYAIVKQLGRGNFGTLTLTPWITLRVSMPCVVSDH